MGGALPYATFTWGAPPPPTGLQGYNNNKRKLHSGKRGIFLQQNTKLVFTVSDRGGEGKIYMYTFIFAVKVA